VWSQEGKKLFREKLERLWERIERGHTKDFKEGAGKGARKEEEGMME